MDPGDDDGLDHLERARRERARDDRAWWATTVLALCCVAGLLVAASGAIDWLFLVMAHATPDILRPSGGSTPWAGRDESQQAAVRVLVGGGCWLIGMAAAWFYRRGVPTALFGIGAVLALVVGSVLLAAVTPDAPERPEERVRLCQEHSGEPNTCPGG